MRVLFITNYPSPYRVDFWNMLGKHVDLTVTFTSSPEEQHHRSSKWFNVDYSGFRAVFLRKKVKISKVTVFYDIFPILKQQFDHIIIGGYSNGTQMAAIEYLKFKKIPFILEADGGLVKKDPAIQYFIKRHFISSANSWMSTGKPTTEYFVHYGADLERIHTYPFTSQQKKDLDNAWQLTSNEKLLLRNKLGMTEDWIVICDGHFLYQNDEQVKSNILYDVGSLLYDDIGIYIIEEKEKEGCFSLMEDQLLEKIHHVKVKTKIQLADYLAAADIYLLPWNNHESEAAVIEAMSFGLPIIISDTSCKYPSFLVDGFNGYMLATNDSVAIKDKIEELVFDADKKRKISCNNLQMFWEMENTNSKITNCSTEAFKEFGIEHYLFKRARRKLMVLEEHIVLFVGQMIHRKGVDVLLKAAIELPDNIGIYFVGGEPTEDYLSYMEKYQLKHVHFVGFKTKEELKEYYRAADLFIMPTREDIWGLVINEAMSYGLPIVSTDRCGAALVLVENGVTGLIVPSEDAQALSKGIIQVLNSSGMRSTIRRKIQNYTIEKMVDAHMQLFQGET